jgi:D-glycero-D-manno-heptose 1,7-bisphosphate phosphatase
MRPVPTRPAAVFVDRDGTVIEDLHYLGDPQRVRLLPGAAEAIAAFNAAGVPVIMVTNQSGIGRGLVSEAAFHAVQARVAALLRERGASLDAVYHCPHGPEEGCGCRKPAGGLFLRAARDLDLDLSASVFAGDRFRDLECGLVHGGRGFLIAGAEGEDARGARTVAGLEEVAQSVLGGIGGL